MSNSTLYTLHSTLIVGLTGGIGSGKSYIAAQMAKTGYRVYDTDKEAKRLIVTDTELRAQMVALLGPDIYEGDTYRTDLVAARVFAQPALLQQLNQLVHPFVERDILSLTAEGGLAAQRSASAAVLQRSGLLIESALLIESGLYRLCDRVIVVTAPEAVRIARVMRRDHCSEEQVRSRMAAQMSEKERWQYANLIIAN